MALPEAPNSRAEQYLAKIAGQSNTIPEAPNSRVEQYLDYIAENGTVSEEEIAEQVSSWLEENIHEDPTVVIDSSLSVSGAAADAKATGDKISGVYVAFDNYPDGVKAATGVKPLAFDRTGYYTTVDSGSEVTFTTSSNYVSCYTPTSEGDVITVDATGGSSTQRLYVWIDSSGNAIYANGKPAANLSGKRTLTTPSGAVALAINNRISVQDSGYYAYIGSDVDTRIASAVSGKQDALTFDSTPTDGSQNPVTSDGIHDAISSTNVAISTIAERVESMTPIGVVSYWPNEKETVSNTAETITGTLDGPTLTIDADVKTTQINTFFKLDGELEYAAKTNAQRSDYISGLTGTVNLSGGKKYRLTAELVSGSYDGSESDNPDAVYLRAYLIQSGIDNLESAVAFASLGKSKVFIPETNMTVSVVFIIYVKNVTINDLVVKVYLETILQEESSNDANGGIPAYYTDENTTLYGDYKNYLNYKICDINAKATEHDIADSLFFITDYHGVIANRNSGHSPALIKEISSKTGISKLVFGGDAGRTLEYTDYRKWTPAKESTAIYSILSNAASDFYCVVGNHDWNEAQRVTNGALVPHEFAYSEKGVIQYYLARENKPGIVMSTGGCYYFDNTCAKIRYFFLQCDGFSGISNENCYWFGKQLEEVPDGYAILVFIHLGYLNQVCYAENGVSKDYYSSLTPGTVSGIVNLEVKRVSTILDAFQNHAESNSTTYPVYEYDNTGAAGSVMSFDYTSTSGSVIGIICGHTHRDMVLEKTDNPDHVLVVATTTDSYGNNLDYNSSGTLVARTVDTITEQAFDVVQIDLENKVLYMTRIGGGSNRTLSFA